MNRDVLLIVEGKKAEPKLFERIQKIFNFNFNFYCLEANIYSLYKKMKEYDFNANVKDVLIELKPKYKDVLEKKFVFTYLIFDFDPHHRNENETRTIEKIIDDNSKKVFEMLTYFTDESDPTIGKLYINYPMLESYKDCDFPMDNNYKNALVLIEEIKNYKFLVSTKKMSNVKLDKLTLVDFKKLIAQNIYKLNYMFSNNWLLPSYTKYFTNSVGSKILSKEMEYISSSKCIQVLNTSLFLVVDYFRNRNHFYDNIDKL